MIVWYLGVSFFNVGLSKTSISSANTLTNISIIFILLINVVWRKLPFTISQGIGVAMAIFGMGLIGWFDSDYAYLVEGSSVSGDFFVIIGAIFYSIYAVLFKHFSEKHGEAFNVMEVFGYQGLYNFILLPFLLIILHFLGIEIFEIPSYQQIITIFTNAVASSICCDLLQTYSIVLLSPHVVSFGLTLSIPVSYIWDIFQGHVMLDWRFIVAGGFIIGSFIIVVSESVEEMNEKINQPDKKEKYEKLEKA